MLLYPIHHFLLGNIWTSTMFISKIAFVSPCLPAQTLVILLSPFPCVCTHHHKQHPSMDTSECQSNWLSNTFYHGLRCSHFRVSYFFLLFYFKPPVVSMPIHGQNQVATLVSQREEEEHRSIPWDPAVDRLGLVI